MHTIIFRNEDGSQQKATAQVGENLLDVALAAGVAIDAPCSGNGTCGKCRLRIIGGTVDGGAGQRLPQEDFDDGWRLACQATVSSDATVWLPASAGSFKKGIETADLSSPEELQRYEKAVEDVFAAGISRGCEQTGLGCAIDIGTTTVTAALLDLESGQVKGKASAGNGQIIYGADVINRIICQSRPGGVEKLQQAVREQTICKLVDELCAQAGIDSAEISRCVIAGNTTMEHLLVGANGESIRLEPYVPEFLELTGKTASELGLPFAPDAPVVLAPNVGSYVGGDITAGVLANRMWASDEMTLFVDLGTNGELVFGNGDFLLCCACSAGPAFEGGDISCGMRATAGAVQAVKIDETTMEPELDTVGGGKVAGLCGSGLIDMVAELFRCGIINAAGKFVASSERIRHNEHGRGEYVFAWGASSATGGDIAINETDIDNFIRAKGAIFSAIRTMVASLGMEVDFIDRVMIAGGIGSGINMENAMAIGMLPKLPTEKYSYIGNSSLTGACTMLLSSEAEQKCFELGRNMTYLELSSEPSYMDEFVASCFIPHTDASLFE